MLDSSPRGFQLFALLCYVTALIDFETAERQISTINAMG